MDILFIVIVVVVIIIGMLVSAEIYDLVYRLKIISCSKCRTTYNINKDVSWEEMEIIEQGDKTYSLVRFTCYCPKCGKERIFDKKFVVASTDKNGKTSYKNINTLVKNFFKPKTRLLGLKLKRKKVNDNVDNESANNEK